jgi:hypothetical protein
MQEGRHQAWRDASAVITIEKLEDPSATEYGK